MTHYLRCALVAAVAAIVGNGCAGGTATTAATSASVAPWAAAELDVIEFVPPPGSVISRTTVMQATIDYRITGRMAGSEFEVAIMFADRRGEGYSFNLPQSHAATVTVTEPSGRVEIRYPIAAEWQSGRLRRPVEVWFHVIENRKSESRVIAKKGPLRYAEE